jgi:SAM-dependent methyltransferase
MSAETLLDEALAAAGDRPSGLLRTGLLFEIEDTFTPDATLVDIGGGVSLKNAVLSRMGMRVVVFDLFEEYYRNAPSGSYDITGRKKVCQDAGVELVNADIFETDLGAVVKPGTVDIVTSLHVFEHFHRSPRPIVGQALDLLRAGGRLRIEVPNAANLRKRIDLLRGRTNYPTFASFYDSEIWHGHVREYTRGDLQQLAAATGHPSRLFGRNYFGGAIASLPVFLQPIVDHALRPFPGLCGSLFLEITKT